MKEKYGLSAILVTLGAKGCFALINGEELELDACPVKAVDTTAAGDTYVGALVVRLSEGADVEEAMIFASKASSVTVTRRGAQQSIPFRREVEAL